MLIDVVNALEARIDGAEMERDQWRIKATQAKAKADGLAGALSELRSCSRAKIGMEDDFACADKQMRDALAAYSETKP